METTAKTYPANYWKRIVFTFCMGWTIIWIYRAMLSPIYSEIQGTIGQQSNAAMGLISSCYFFGYTALQIPSGFLVDKFGQKKVLIPGFIFFALGVFSIAFARNLMMIYLGAVAAGVGCGTYYGAAFSLTAQHVPAEKKGFSTAIVNSGSALGMILGLTGSSFVVKQLQLPWQTMVFISAGLIVFLVIWFAVMIIDSSKVPVQSVTTSKVEEMEKVENEVVENFAPVTETKGGLFKKELLASYLLYFTTCYAYYLIVTWLPNFLESERGITGSMIGVITSMIAVTAVPGALFFAKLSDKHKNNKEKIIIGLEIAAFILVAGSILASNASILAIVLLAYGFLGKLAVDPVLISFVSDKAEPGKMASTLGTFNFFGMSSSVVAPWLTGLIIDKTGSGEIGFYIGAGLLIFGTIVFLIASKRAANRV
ncbi:MULTISPECIES: MFS transporter [unclassified Facklamia]|uniref:MFS transporter n=1 Tax=Aerococcaceae TaxID=186827 RepID=UPI0013BD7986|nr:MULTISPECIES: MFS transporter [unclassified Facklamia]NEW64692.1 MFS transporter [Facklamia sp. 252]NEW68017.1 MFS transporter [Facklamia sp. 253]QQD65045.1 MFS transporter [Aerococcaceae bacterium zg-252]